MRQVHLLGPSAIQVVDLPDPQPAAGEVVLELVAALTCGTDLKVWKRGGHPRMLTAPCAFGHELCGRVRACGEGVDDWQVGELVVLANSAPCGACEPCLRGRDNLCRDLHYWNGAFADLALVPARFVRQSLRRVPVGLAPELAALAEPLACVHHGIAVAGPVPGETVAVLGCGPIGLLFVAELARLGIRTVALDPNPQRLEVAAALGAAVVHQIIDRQRPVSPLPLDLLVEATGSPSAWAAATSLIAAGGRVLYFGGVPGGQVLQVDAVRFHYEELALLGAYHYTRKAFDHALATLAASGERLRPLLSEHTDLDGVGLALERMARREVLKVAILP